MGTSPHTLRNTVSNLTRRRKNAAHVFLILFAGALFASQAQQPNSATIHGKVVDLFGNPIPAAEIQIKVVAQRETLGTRTDKEGFYEIPKVPFGRFVVTAMARGFRQERIETTLYEGEANKIDFGLEVGALSDDPSFNVSGVVTKNNSPISGASVIIENLFNHRILRMTETDRQGKYQLAVRNPGLYLIYSYKNPVDAVADVVLLSAALPRPRVTKDLNLK